MILDGWLTFFTDIGEPPSGAVSVDIGPDFSDGSKIWLFVHAKLSGEAEKGELIFDVADRNGADLWSFNATVYRSCALVCGLPAGCSGRVYMDMDTMDGLVVTAGVTLSAQHAHNLWEKAVDTDDLAYESCLFLTSEGYPLVPVGYKGLVSLDMQ